MTHADLADLAGLLADRTRAQMCIALLDGRAWTAGELAAHAGVAPSTATEHLNRLIDGGLLAQRRQGRHRYVQLAGPHVASLLETMTTHLGPARPTSLRAATASAALARGRTCYDHLAGRLGVGLTDALGRAGFLRQDNGFALTDDGMSWLTATLGVSLVASGRPMARECLDWTERRSHLAGVAGAAVCGRLLDNGWVRRVGSGRAVLVTPAGAEALGEQLGMDTAGLT